MDSSTDSAVSMNSIDGAEKKVGGSTLMNWFRNMSAPARFSFVLSFWAFGALGTLAYTLAIVARLDVAFFESNGMIVNPELREAFYIQIFAFDILTILFCLGGIAGVAIISYIFAKSQTNYFARLAEVLTQYANTGEVPNARNMGGLHPYIERFFNVLLLRVKGAEPSAIKTILANSTRDWPSSPSISWKDQSQFGLVAIGLSVLFAISSFTFFHQVNEQVVNLSQRLVRWSTPTGPNFLKEQFEIVQMVAWSILLVMTGAFLIVAIRYGKMMGQSTYSCLRDLRRFMEGNTKQRLLLRAGDLGREYIPAINKALDRIAQKL